MTFNEIYKQLTLMKLCVYSPVSYILPSKISKYEVLYDTDVKSGASKFKQIDRELSLVALMTTNLLKRLESSVHSFRLTLEKLQKNHLLILKKIDDFNRKGFDPGFEDLTNTYEAIESEDDDLFDDSEGSHIGGKVKIKLSDMDILRWEEDLRADLFLIERLHQEMSKVTPEQDYKLQHLLSQIYKKIDNPINSNNKKILIFTAFADTADYLYENISNQLLHSRGLHSAKVTGSDTPRSTIQNEIKGKKHYDFQSILTLFSPISKERDKVLPDDVSDIDILIGTDCISEGQNLQDCDFLINYDIHWNPVRIIQRFGRIDRIGSPNEKIQLVNYWPDISLDEYINLKERVENRMVIADVAATGDDNVLNHKTNDVSYRREQLRKLQEEVIDMEDVKTGVSITDLGLNDFRMDLLNYIKENEDLSKLPNGLHTVVPAQVSLGLKPGVIFTLRNINEQVNLNQQNRLHPYYLVYVSDDGELINNHFEVKKLLDLTRTACKGISSPIFSVSDVFNRLTSDGKDMKIFSGLLDQAIKSIVNVKEDKDIDSLFTSGRTTALVDSIHGLDDFELVKLELRLCANMKLLPL
jgi:superfamily II DNA or RNA helicase